MRLSVIVNPTARSGGAAKAAARALERLRERASAIEVHERADPDAAAETLRRLRENPPDAAVVVGGDGTVHLALNALVGSGIPLGIIPAGTGNDFAVASGIPKDLVAAADIVFDGVTASCDLAEVTRADGEVRFFGTILASGFDSLVNDLANRMRWPRGNARYNVAIGVEFMRLRPLELSATWIDEHGEAGGVAGPLMIAAVGNIAHYGGGIPMCIGADAHDGLLDVAIVHPAGRMALLGVLAAVFRAKHRGHRLVEMHRVREVRVDAASLTGYADGDPIGTLPLMVRPARAALSLRVPAPAAR